MSNWIAAGTVVACLAASGNATASSRAENDIFRKWLGTWTCEGTADGPQGTKTKYQVTWKWTSVLDGQWYAAVYARPRQGKVVAYQANITAGYDRADKKYLFASFDGFGGWTRLSSVDGASYAGEGTPQGPRAPVRITFTKGKDESGRDSDSRIDVKLEVGGPPITESCRRQ
jgi:hypothetical protein